MFDIQKYKRFAKIQLQNRWTVPVLMTLVIILVTSIFSIPDYIKILSSEGFEMLKSGNFSHETWQMLADSQNAATPEQTFLISLLQLIIAEILSLASLNVYIKMTRSPDKVPFSSFIEGFNNWGRAVLGSLWQLLWTWLWSMLFIIPGIIKYISYSQMFFIIAEYDNISVSKAMRISKIITRGHKWDLFVMGLSFFGWILLNILTLGLSELFTGPYIKLSFVNAYHGMLKEAVTTGAIRPEDLSE
jgi:uncharacterized membrane protein